MRLRDRDATVTDSTKGISKAIAIAFNQPEETAGTTIFLPSDEPN